MICKLTFYKIFCSAKSFCARTNMLYKMLVRKFCVANCIFKKWHSSILQFSPTYFFVQIFTTVFSSKLLSLKFKVFKRQFFQVIFLLFFLQDHLNCYSSRLLTYILFVNKNPAASYKHTYLISVN